MVHKSTSGYLSEENENTNLKIYMHPMFIAALFTIVKIWKQHVSIDEWMDKENIIYLYNGILFRHKKLEILPLGYHDWNLSALC